MLFRSGYINIDQDEIVNYIVKEAKKDGMGPYDPNDVFFVVHEVMIGNIIDDKAVQDAVGYEKYDSVAANSLADVLVPLTPVIIHQMKPGAVYITSGIIEDKENVVVEAVKAAGLEVLEVNHQGEWVSVVARKNA